MFIEDLKRRNLEFCKNSTKILVVLVKYGYSPMIIMVFTQWILPKEMILSNIYYSFGLEMAHLLMLQIM